MALKSKRGRPRKHVNVIEEEKLAKKGRRTACEKDGVRHVSHKKHMQEKKNRTVCS
jgi:hypothetical protein